ncbi:MAG: SDR family NAD(P)-dependent oxidoreductase [Rhodomicrobium sp.]
MALCCGVLCHALLPEMQEKKRGHTVNVTSPASYMVWPSAAVHIAARQALKGFSDALRLEAAPGDILASLVVPRLVESTHWE